MTDMIEKGRLHKAIRALEAATADELASAERFWCKVDRRGPDECWRWTAGLGGNGRCPKYGSFNFRRRMERAHRVALVLSGVSIPAGMVVRHRCDVAMCCNPAHLIVGTQKENVADRYDRGRYTHLVGSAHGMARQTEAQVLEIRTRIAAGQRRKEVMRGMGITLSAYHSARCHWKHVAYPEGFK